MHKLYEVELDLFEDYASGEYGFAHKNMICDYDGFNAFYNGIGLFHDVFEHYFEGYHKYFKGGYKGNISGEVAAMGACTYFTQELYIQNRMFKNTYNPWEEMIKSTITDIVIEGISRDCIQFGEELMCNIPYQRPTDNGSLEYIIDSTYTEIKDAKISEDEDYKETCLSYKNSITKNKLSRLYRWGYRMAEKNIPYNNENREMCNKFISFWDDFTKQIKAEELFQLYYGVTFKLYKHKNIVKWSTVFRPKYGAKSLKLNHNSHIPDIYDLYKEEY